MKTQKASKRLVLVLMFVLNAAVHAQQIDSMVVSPSSFVGVNDTVKIYVYNTFFSGGCAGTAYYSKAGFNVMANSLHCQGALTVICNDIDTIVVNPPHLLGTYRVSFVLNSGFGGPPCTPGFVPNDYDTVYFTVGSNLAPTISDISDDTTCKNASLGPLLFALGDEDLSTLLLTATSDNQSLITNNNISIAGSGANRTVILTPSSNQLGTANIKIVVEDNQNAKDSAEFTVYVEDCSVGISNSREIEMDVYPNPSNGIVAIDFGRMHSKVELSVRNLSGQLLNTWNYEKVKEIELDLGLQRGVYVLNISIDRREVNCRIVID